MAFDLWLAFVVTVIIFMLTPGPSHMLMLSNSIANGFAKASATAAGDLSANFLQMLAASLGLASMLYNAEILFLVIKWFGVLYLLYMGLKLLLAKHSIIERGARRSTTELYFQGFITSASNPKAVLFFAALFPQFINSEQALAPQFWALCVTYLLIDGVFLCIYGKFADSIVGRFIASGRQLNIIAGGLFISAAMLLGLKSVKS